MPLKIIPRSCLWSLALIPPKFCVDFKVQGLHVLDVRHSSIYGSFRGSCSSGHSLRNASLKVGPLKLLTSTPFRLHPQWHLHLSGSGFMGSRRVYSGIESVCYSELGLLCSCRDKERGNEGRVRLPQSVDMVVTVQVSVATAPPSEVVGGVV